MSNFVSSPLVSSDVARTAPPSGGSSGTSFDSSLGQQDWWTAIDNFMTGNLDFQREAEFQNKAMQFSAQEAQKQRDYEERLANTAYQRAVKDMSNAGLNPYLAYQSGGAFTPSGATAVPTAGHASRAGSGVAALLGVISQIVKGSFLLASSASAPAPVKTYNFNTYLSKAVDKAFNKK